MNYGTHVHHNQVQALIVKISTNVLHCYNKKFTIQSLYGKRNVTGK